MNRDEKAAVVEELSAKFVNAKLAVLTDYRGLTVPALEALRRELKSNSAEIRVAKNTLLKRAIQGTSFEPLDEHLQGTTALTVSDDDPVGPAKVLVKFQKDHPQLAIKGAVLDGKTLSTEDLMALSKLPGIDQLRAQLLALMLAVPTGFVRVLNAVPQGMVNVLSALKDKKEQDDN